MKFTKNNLHKMIEECLLQVIKEQQMQQIPATRFRQKFRAKSSTTKDPNTLEGRQNIINPVLSPLDDVQTRLQIIEKMCINASRSKTRQEFKQNLIQIFDNLTSLQKTDIEKLRTAFTNVENTVFPSEGSVTTEQNLNPDSAEGRRALIKDVFAQVSSTKKLSDEAQRILTRALNITNLSMFKNEIKALGDHIARISSNLLELNKAFIVAFKAYEAQRGRSADDELTSAKVSRKSQPPPIPPEVRKKTNI